MKQLFDFGIAVSDQTGRIIHYRSSFDANPITGTMADHVKDPDALLLAWAKAVTTGEPIQINAVAKRNDRPFVCHLFRLPPAAFLLSFSLWGKQKADTALTDRDYEVCQLLIDGLDVSEISERLGISPQSVNSHRRSAMERLGATTAEQLGVKFFQYRSDLI